MADNDNQGQWGNREDTVEQAQRGGEESTGSFDDIHGADPSTAGAEGGRNSHGSDEE